MLGTRVEGGGGWGCGWGACGGAVRVASVVHKFVPDAASLAHKSARAHSTSASRPGDLAYAQAGHVIMASWDLRKARAARPRRSTRF